MNNNYGGLQDLTLFFKILMGKRKNFLKFVENLVTRPQEGSPALYYIIHFYDFVFLVKN